MLAHVSGIPVEELVPLAGGTGGLLAMRLWLRMRVRARMRR
jgi:alpha-beta hydrolase superfamily lysophospholipase